MQIHVSFLRQSEKIFTDFNEIQYVSRRSWLL
jgi:hypothetical protein